MPKSQSKHSTCGLATGNAAVEHEQSPPVPPPASSAAKPRTKSKRDLPGVYQRGNVWVAVVEGPRDPVTGKRRKIWLRERFTSRTKAEAASRAMYEKIRAGALVAGSARITVAAHLTRWLAHIQPRIAPRTAASYRGIVTGRLIPTLGNVKLARLSALQISDAVTMWTSVARNDGRAGKLSSRSVQIALVVLRMALRQAVKWGALTSNVAELVDAPRVERKTQAFVCADDLDRLFVEAAKCGAESGMLAAITIAIGLGLRRGELLGLKWADVDFERRTVAIARTLERVDGRLTTKAPKTKLSRRTARMPAFVLDALRAHSAAQAKHRLAHGLGNSGPEGWVFAGATGGALDMDAFSKRFKLLAQRAGLPHVHLHSLRHGFAVLSLQAGIDLKTVSVNLGHSSIRLTGDTYSHVVASVGEDAAERIDAVIRGRKRVAQTP